MIILNSTGRDDARKLLRQFFSWRAATSSEYKSGVMFVQTGDFVKLRDDSGRSGTDVDISEAMKVILSRSTKLQSMDSSSELLTTLLSVTSTCAPMLRRLWSTNTRVCIHGVFYYRAGVC